jgi:hypothetical protein
MHSEAITIALSEGTVAVNSTSFGDCVFSHDACEIVFIAINGSVSRTGMICPLLIDSLIVRLCNSHLFISIKNWTIGHSRPGRITSQKTKVPEWGKVRFMSAL